MILTFSNWKITKPSGSLGYQYDNDSQVLTLGGILPEGYTWDALVQSGQNFDVWNLEPSKNGPTITLSEDNLSATGEYYVQIRGTNGEVVQHTNIVSLYVPRSLVGPGTWPTLPTEFSQAEQNIQELNAHPPVPGSNGYWLLWDLSSHSYQESDLPVPVGPAGPPNVLEIGTVETLPADQPATASITGESPAQKLNLGIPQGKQGATGNPGAPGKDGQDGVTPTLSAGNVETLEPDQPATASVTGEGPAYQINLGIPQGKTGETGAQGVQGEIGPRGYTFTPAVDDAGNLSWTNDGGLPNPEEVNIKGPIGATGPQGNPGATPTIAVGTVTTLDPGQDATAEITGETPNLTLNLGIPEGQPGQDGVQLNDSAINTTEAWSSKKIADTFCPPFSVSGNPVLCNPVEDYPLSAVVTLEPQQAGSGDPSPENVRPISGWGGVTVNVSGKNLLSDENFQSSERNGITFTKMGNGVVHIEGTSISAADSVVVYDVPQLPPGQYFGIVGSYLNIVVKKAKTGTNYYYRAFTGMTIEQGDVILYYYFAINNGVTVNKDDYIFLAPGESAFQVSDHEPYQGTIATITLPETTYGGTADAVTGAGSKTWGFIASYNGETLPGEWISDRDVYAPGTTPTTGAQVAYKLATPEPFQATGNQALPAVAGLNTVYTDGDSVAVSGRQDLLYTLQTMQAQTTNLNRFIAEGGTT